MLDDFLIEREPITWTAPEGFPASLVPAGLFTQDAPSGLEVLLATASRRPTAVDLRRAWSKRRAGRVSPVLLVAAYPTAEGRRVSLCGPAGDQPMVQHDAEMSQAERLAEVALSEPSHHAATRFLLANLPELESPMPGLRNVGLLATQELRVGVPGRPDWRASGERARSLLGLRGRQLVEGLGYGVEVLSTNTSMLTINGRNRAVAVFCDEDEPFDAPAQRFNGTSPVSQALAVADQQNVDWVILTRSSEIRLYAARADTGVGRKGRAETFVELNLSLLPAELAGYLPLLFSVEALIKNGTMEEILDGSERFAADLAGRLRERVYYETVPALASAIASKLDHEPTSADLDDAYEQVMLILFRLLFVAYAEDKDLLPYRTNSRYRDHSLQRLANRLTEDLRAGAHEYDAKATSMWGDVRQLWEAVDNGNHDWGVPPYNGGLFSSDPQVSRAGAALSDMQLTNQEFAPALAALLVDKGDEGYGPVDFRSLSVREFGTIYEGLLESRLAMAQDDLTVARIKGQDQYIPARGDDEVAVAEGSVYLHNRSGVRKATGSYFTKPFAVEHLLDHALEPALDDHIARLEALREAGDEAALAEAFFDFRCADIAMGSGHFLVAALDRIEARLSAWLALHQAPAVTNELLRLRSAAEDALGDLKDGVEIESSSLLRRQVARHCVYGVDRNRVAVELARLAIWVHTFVPGLPLSLLDHNLVCGDSLTGVGTLDEVVTAFEPNADPDKPSLTRLQVEQMLDRAGAVLQRLARISDANKREIDDARSLNADMVAAVAGARAAFHVITARRADICDLPENFDEEVLLRLSQTEVVTKTLRELMPLHFPAAFPEVFLRDRPGFDCLLGNPPWESVVVAEHVWWGIHLPGIRGQPIKAMNDAVARFRVTRPDLEALFEQELENAESMRAVLRKTFPALGSGYTDLYKAFAWRNWHLVRQATGRVGVVLPRGALQAKGSEQWRNVIIDEGTFSNVAVLQNSAGWVFDDVHFQYTVGLCSLLKGVEHSDAVRFSGPYSSRPSFQRGRTSATEPVPTAEFLSWSDDASFPQLPDHPGALRLFRKMRMHPRMDGQVGRTDGRTDGPPASMHYRRWRVRPLQGDLNATNDKHRFILDGGESARSRNSTPQQTSTASSSTVASPSTPRTRRHQ